MVKILIRGIEIWNQIKIQYQMNLNQMFVLDQSYPQMKDYQVILQRMSRERDSLAFVLHGGFEIINEAPQIEEGMIKCKEIATDLKFHVLDS